MGKEVWSGEFRSPDPQDSAYTEFWTASSGKIWGVLLQRSLGAAHRMTGPASLGAWSVSARQPVSLKDEVLSPSLLPPVRAEGLR